jgi:hypothetical protein
MRSPQRLKLQEDSIIHHEQAHDAPLATEDPKSTNANISLADEEAVKQVLVRTVLGLWDIVNDLTRLRPTKQTHSTGIRVQLPFEQDVNPFVGQAFEHKTFFTRLHHSFPKIASK